MAPTPRQKACLACAESKRRCDKQVPECQRCLDRDVGCFYPQPKRGRRDAIVLDDQTEDLFAIENYADPNALMSNLDFGELGVIGAADLDFSLPDVMIPYIDTQSKSVADLSAQGSALESGNGSSTPCPWFLQDETWVMQEMQHSKEEPACVTSAEVESFIRGVDGMLQSWVRNGHNSFIHRRLYDKGMPPSLQDAFTTLAAYTARTPAVKEIILQIAEERSTALAHQSTPIAGGAQGILAHLGRVQALFIFVFVRLFDGSVRLRASAEQQLPTLRLWVNWMWEAVKRYRGEDGFLGRRPIQWNVGDFESEYDACQEQWRLWILTESVRRTHITVDTVAKVYQTMAKGHADCAGAVMFTARRGLWEAESAVEWFDLSCAKCPLLVPSLQPRSCITQYAAGEIDDFVKMYWTFIIGTDKIRYWIDHGNRISRK